jgi:hypothetical protein
MGLAASSHSSKAAAPLYILPDSGMAAAYLRSVKVRLLRHTAAPAVPDSGSYEVCFPDGRESVYFYWDDNPGRRSITMALSSEEAQRKAKELVRSEQDKLEAAN